MLSPNTWLAVVWLTWVVGWAVAARWSADTVVQQSSRSRLAHSIPMWGGAVLLSLDARKLGVLGRPIVPPGVWVPWAGVAAVALGLGFASSARIHLGRLWSSEVTLKSGHAIVRSGPYAITRHPIYTGLLLALAGTALFRGTLVALAAFALFALGVMLKIRQEEILLMRHFGDAYRSYREQVPAVVPMPRFGAIREE